MQGGTVSASGGGSADVEEALRASDGGCAPPAPAWGSEPGGGAPATLSRSRSRSGRALWAFAAARRRVLVLAGRFHRAEAVSAYSLVGFALWSPWRTSALERVLHSVPVGEAAP